MGPFVCSGLCTNITVTNGHTKHFLCENTFLTWEWGGKVLLDELENNGKNQYHYNTLYRSSGIWKKMKNLFVQVHYVS